MEIGRQVCLGLVQAHWVDPPALKVAKPAAAAFQAPPVSRLRVGGGMQVQIGPHLIKGERPARVPDGAAETCRLAQLACCVKLDKLSNETSQ